MIVIGSLLIVPSSASILSIETGRAVQVDVVDEKEAFFAIDERNSKPTIDDKATHVANVTNNFDRELSKTNVSVIDTTGSTITASDLTATLSDPSPAAGTTTDLNLKCSVSGESESGIDATISVRATSESLTEDTYTTINNIDVSCP